MAAHHSGFWDSEGLSEDRQLDRAAVSNYKSDEELLKTLAAADLCTRNDDDVFNDRIRKFLNSYQDNKATQKVTENKPEYLNDKQNLKVGNRDPDVQPRVAIQNSGVDRPSTVRLEDLPEKDPFSIVSHQPPHRSIFPTPIAIALPMAKSTTFAQGYVADGGSSTRKSIGIRPRQLQ